MDITEFLLARIAEDEADITYLLDEVEIVGGRHVNARKRYREDCEAKRTVVLMLTAAVRHGLDAFDQGLRSLAQPYADHPDFDESWRA